MNKSFWQSGHTATLLTAFLYFDLSFMVWYILGPLSIQIAGDLGLSPQQRGMLVATPILAGALLRPVFGALVDHIKPKMAGALGQIIVILALLVAWLVGIHSFQQALLLGLFLGVAGASFAVALPLASRWYPPEHQGTALGIAGAGNSGTVLAALFAPGLAAAFGWTQVFGFALIPLVVVFVLYMMLAKDAPECPPAKSLTEYLTVLHDKDAWWFMGFYLVTFGGFVGMAGALPGYFHDQFAMAPVEAGYYTAACVFGGSMLRPIGGALADRFGGIRTLSIVYLIVAVLMFALGFNPASKMVALALLVGAMLALGAGNGSVFQLVPQRFRKEIGVMTGLIGMAGGIGGFLLAAGLGIAKQTTGDYQLGLWLYAMMALIGSIGLYSVKLRWRTTWGAVTTARI